MTNPNRDRLTGLTYEDLWAFIKSRRGDVVAQRNYYGALANLLARIFEVPQFNGKISLEDLDDAFAEALATLKEPLGKAGKRELEGILHKRLGWERDYDFHFDLGWALGFENGFQFGYGELRPLSKLPRRSRDLVRRGFGLPQRDNGSKAERHAAGHAEERWFLCIRQRTVGWHNAIERAETAAERSLAAYELVTGVSEFTKMPQIAAPSGLDFVIVCDDRKLSGRYREPRFRQPIVNMPGFKDLVVQMTKLMRKENRSELENRIVSVVDVFAMIRDETPPELRFLLKVICLEAMFLSDDDRDYLGQKLAEKIAFILGDNKTWIAFAFELLPHLGFRGNFGDIIEDKFVNANKSESRRRLHREIVRLYGKRSAFVHQGATSRKSAVTPYDYDMLSWLVRLSVIKMLSLAEEGVTHLKKRNNDDSSSFDFLIEKLKY